MLQPKPDFLTDAGSQDHASYPQTSSSCATKFKQTFNKQIFTPQSVNHATTTAGLIPWAAHGNNCLFASVIVVNRARSLDYICYYPTKFAIISRPMLNQARFSHGAGSPLKHALKFLPHQGPKQNPEHVPTAVSVEAAIWSGFVPIPTLQLCSSFILIPKDRQQIRLMK